MRRALVHPRGLDDDPVIRVPWLECPHDERRAVTRGPPAESETTDADVVSERLRDPGYVS